jgi:hypothetical protein
MPAPVSPTASGTAAGRAPGTVTLDVWGVRPRAVPGALLRMETGRRTLRRTPGLRFAKLLGTGSGRTFTMRGADPRHWALLAVWTDEPSVDAFEESPLVRDWNGLAEERLRIVLEPLASRGRWSGHEPFGQSVDTTSGTRTGPPPQTGRTGWTGPVAALTRARIAPGRLLTFWRAVPPVAAEVRHCPGLTFALGFGEAPLGFQGTFSIWRSATALTDFAYRSPAHLHAIHRTGTTGWYAEQLFARFAVRSVTGHYGGRTVACR